MSKRTISRVIAAALFFPLSLWATYKVGYFGIFAVAVAGPGEAQVFADLTVALTLVLPFLASDARRHGINPWPWFVGTLLLGSIAPLTYFLWRDAAAAAAAARVHPEI